jgi:hypothetical protein|nr:MAG TPA: YopX protein [Caudoviricetes sp.]
MVPKFRAWDKETQTMLDVSLIDFKKSVLVGEHWEFGETNFINFDDVILMQSTGLKDKNGKEIFEGDILKFNDEWDDYCYEGYVDGSTEGINFVEIERETTCFTFGKFQTSDSSLLYFMKDEYLSFEDLITDKDFEFEIVGNIYENPELLEVTE